ncbi:hypothetical protein C8Q74DRAFT_547404 [Fomes fomentarius]|nr:hypothetical protein C8Q74DRAFT_547404 [Fomes fomentarius]
MSIASTFMVCLVYNCMSELYPSAVYIQSDFPSLCCDVPFFAPRRWLSEDRRTRRTKAPTMAARNASWRASDADALRVSDCTLPATATWHRATARIQCPIRATMGYRQAAVLVSVSFFLGVLSICLNVDYRILFSPLTGDVARDGFEFYTTFYNAPPAIKASPLLLSPLEPR